MAAVAYRFLRREAALLLAAYLGQPLHSTAPVLFHTNRQIHRKNEDDPGKSGTALRVPVRTECRIGYGCLKKGTVPFRPI